MGLEGRRRSCRGRLRGGVGRLRMMVGLHSWMDKGEVLEWELGLGTSGEGRA